MTCNLRKLSVLALSITVAFSNFSIAFAEPTENSTTDNEYFLNETTDESNPKFEMLDENGNVEEVLDFELANTYYMSAESQSQMNSISPRAIVTPDPDTNFYDLSEGTYSMYFGQSKTVYEMDKWFHANSDGELYISTSVYDADGKIMFYRYSFDYETHFWLIHEYELQLNSYNYRARFFNGRVRNLDSEGEKYYTYLVTSTGDEFLTGLLKASWESIDDPYGPEID